MRAASAAGRAGGVRGAFLVVALIAAGCQKPAETPPPRLTALAPNRVQSGQSVVLQGTGFAAEPALNAVYFGNARARVEMATPTELRVRVPDLEIAMTEEARVAVRVVVSNLESGTLEVDFLPGVASLAQAASEVPETVIEVGESPAPAAEPPRLAAADPVASDPTLAPTSAPPPELKATPAPKPPAASEPAPARKPPVRRAATPAPEDAELARAREELAEGRHAAALELFESVLERSPGDAEASAGREEALRAIRSRRSLVTGETRALAAPTSGSAPAGFAADDVEVAGEVAPARIGFEMRPDRVAPGAAWRLKIFLANDGRNRVSVTRLSAQIEGDDERRSVTPALRSQRVDGGKREQVGELGGVWGEAVSEWSVEVTVITDEGVRYVSQLTWK
jgi:hypothetical protein